MENKKEKIDKEEIFDLSIKENVNNLPKMYFRLDINEIQREKEKVEKKIEELNTEIIKREEKKEANMKNNELFAFEYKRCEDQLNEKMKYQEEIIAKIPKDKLYLKSNKNSDKKNNLKFSLNEIEKNEMYKILNKDLLDYQKYITEILHRQNKLLNIENKITELKNLFDILLLFPRFSIVLSIHSLLPDIYHLL